jgi:mycofactocin system transcriptional regulator
MSGRPVGRRRSTTPDHIADIALDLFSTYGFSEVSVDDVALASGIARRTLFRYYSTKSAIPWGDFDSHLREFTAVLDDADPAAPIGTALRTALLDFNTIDDATAARHRQRMQLILQTAELQAYSMTMYAGWRAVVADFVARRTGARVSDLIPQTLAWLMLGVALSAHEFWLADESVSLPQALGDAFDTMAGGLNVLSHNPRERSLNG